MELTELQAAFDQLTVEHAALVAEKADLQLRFDATTGFILDLQKQFQSEKDAHAITAAQRDTFKKGFDTQSRNHETAMRRVKELGGSATPPAADGSTPAT